MRTISAAAARSAIVSKRGTTETGSRVRSRTRSTSSGEVVADTITVSSARAPCRALAVSTAAKTPRVRSVGLRTSSACRRTSSFARWNPKSSMRRSSAASPPAAIRAPPFASRLRRTTPRSASSSSASLYTSSPSLAQMNDSFRRYGSNSFWWRISAAYAGSSSSSQAIDSRSSSEIETSDPLDAIATASSRTSRRYRSSASRRALSSASTIVSPSTAGLPSRSPPIHVPNEKGGGAPGTRRRYAASSRSPASRRLCSKNQSPWRISSTTRGRSPRTSSVCQSIVISSARRSSTALRSPRVSIGSSRATRRSAMRTWAWRSVRLVASVG